MIELATAEHEAAHLVVGLALGLKLKRAFVRRADLNGVAVDGLVWFSGFARRKLAQGVMACAGIAYERRIKRVGFTWYDEKFARECFSSRSDLETGVRLAREILDCRRRAHTRLAVELCDRDLTARDIAALVHEL